MITLIINFTLNNKSYSKNIFTKGSFSYESIKREICDTLMYDEIDPNDDVKENIKEDIRQLLMNTININSIEIKELRIDDNLLIDTVISEKVLKNPNDYLIKIVKDK